MLLAYDKTLMSYDLKLRVPSGVAAHLSFALEKDRIEVVTIKADVWVIAFRL